VEDTKKSDTKQADFDAKLKALEEREIALSEKGQTRSTEWDAKMKELQDRQAKLAKEEEERTASYDRKLKDLQGRESALSRQQDEAKSSKEKTRDDNKSDGDEAQTKKEAEIQRKLDELSSAEQKLAADRAALQKSQSDLARELLKDPYKFDFLSLGTEYKEKDLENALVEHITKFLLELGAGFSYVGRQYHLEVGGDDFYIDLLFYHLKLRCFVVIELKTGKFIPEYASKLNFYLNVVDDTLKHSADEPSIGILICKERNKVVAEYALRGINKPIGVSEYELSENIPNSLKGKLPTIEEIEAELKDINNPDGN
ncbi:MAG: DUF1016 family protein, partial [Proteobacteria bacterium]